jgi:nicotinamide-nucleotide amidase
MRLAVIASGDELTTGAVSDENSAWISDRALAIGGETVLHLTVGDGIAPLVDAINLAAARARHVVVTGGLGPTADDLTRDAVCQCLGVSLVENQAALDRLHAIFQTIGREMTPNNRRQAMIPAGATLIPNPIGTAPGFAVEHAGASFYFLPGVPRECRAMMEASVVPMLAAAAVEPRAGARVVFRHLLFRTFGMTESALDQELSSVALPEGARLGYRAVFPEIHLKLYARGETAAAVEAALGEAAARVRAKVGAVIYSEDGRALEEVVLDLCRARKKTLALAESCTGGLVAKRLTDIPGASDVLDRGAVTYSNRAKSEMLGVPPELIRAHGAVSAEVARAMAAGLRERSGADLCLSITGIAGPTGGAPDKPVGTVHIALADAAGIWERRYLFARAERTWVRELTAEAALEILRRRLLNLEELTR